MVVNYDKYPILKYLNSDEAPCKYNFPANLECDNFRKNKLLPFYVALFKNWKSTSREVRKNVTILSDTYFEAMKRSYKSFDRIDLSDFFREKGPFKGCIIFRSSKGINIAIVYEVYDVDKVNIWGLHGCDTLYFYIKQDGTKLDYFHTSDKGVRSEELPELQLIYNYIAVLKCFLLMEKYAKIEIKDIAGKSKIKGDKKNDKIINQTDYNVKIRDCTWFTTICRNEGFNVRGHFRLQPKKVNGEWIKELIYINEFEKHGYHRTAKIEKDYVQTT